ncbi:MAG: indolepyruvate oxidoreductase subunit beta [Betaproteobacteria bacterium]|nr:indolepyruvate oxidoreductase subunit beta [Betaproteobacteria bacterium]
MTNSDSPTTNILVVGIGGQGVMTAAEILAEAALSIGLDVKKTEVAGMSQRGGVVTSHLRMGARVLSPQIAPGQADLLLGFEPAEAMRWSHYLRPRGAVVVNTLRLTPPVVTLGLYDYPEDPVAVIRSKGMRVRDFDAGAVARKLGDLRLVNSVMLGAVADALPFPAEALKSCLLSRFASKGESILDLNRQAFAAGRQLAAQEH